MNSFYFFKVFILFSVYIITAKIGLALYAVNDFATLVWMPTGIAWAALLMYGYRLWPGIAAGAFVINLLAGAPVLTALGIAAGNTLEALIAFYLLTHFVGFDFRLARLRDALGLIAVAFIAPLVSTLMGVGSLMLSGLIPLEGVPVTSAAWWVGDVLGALIFTPLLVRYLPYPLPLFSLRKIAEAGMILACLIVLAFLIYWTDHGRIGTTLFAYVLFLPLTWAALRTGPRGVTVALLIMSCVATAAVVLRRGAFADMNPQQALFELQLFTVFVVLIFLPFAAIVEHGKGVMRSLRRQNEELQYAMEKISSEDQAKSDFLAVLAHELRNPLAPIINSLELAKLRATELKENEMGILIDSISSHAHTIKLLLDDLLDISRISRNKFILEKKRIEISAVIAQAIATIDPFYKERKHVLSLSLPEEKIWIEADALRLQQVLVNILNNAGKYTHPGGIIELEVRREKEKVCLRLQDSGIGIDASMLKRIFEPFVQLNAERKVSVGTGLGIGLSLTKRILELHGGTIQAKSRGAGKGSEFTIHLPLGSALKEKERFREVEETQLSFGLPDNSPLPQ